MGYKKSTVDPLILVAAVGPFTLAVDGALQQRGLESLDHGETRSRAPFACQLS